MFRNPNIRRLRNVLSCFMIGLICLVIGLVVMLHRPKGFVKTEALKAVSSVENGSSFSVVCGMKYGLPGRTSRTELMWAGTLLSFAIRRS